MSESTYELYTITPSHNSWNRELKNMPHSKYLFLHNVEHPDVLRRRVSSLRDVQYLLLGPVFTQFANGALLSGQPEC
jgi:hypothetical protein